MSTTPQFPNNFHFFILKFKAYFLIYEIKNFAVIQKIFFYVINKNKKVPLWKFRLKMNILQIHNFGIENISETENSVSLRRQISL